MAIKTDWRRLDETNIRIKTDVYLKLKQRAAKEKGLTLSKVIEGLLKR